MGQAQINVRTRACSRTSIARTRQAALTHNVRGKELKRITMYYRIACKKCLLYVYKYMILAKNVLSLFIVPIPT